MVARESQNERFDMDFSSYTGQTFVSNWNQTETYISLDCTCLRPAALQKEWLPRTQEGICWLSEFSLQAEWELGGREPWPQGITHELFICSILYCLSDGANVEIRASSHPVQRCWWVSSSSSLVFRVACRLFHFRSCNW